MFACTVRRMVDRMMDYMVQGKKGALIGDRYELHMDVGLGTFGRVVECWDLVRRRRVAVKVVRKVRR